MKHLTSLLAAILLSGAAFAAPIATIPADTNVGAAAIYSQAVTGGTLYVTRVTDITGKAPAVATNFVSTAVTLPNAQVGTLNATTGSLAAGKITGALNVTLISSNATPGAQLVRTAAVELARRSPDALCIALHPGTVATALSAPFAATGLEVHSPSAAARHLLAVVDQLTADANGGFFDWRGQPVPW